LTASKKSTQHPGITWTLLSCILYPRTVIAHRALWTWPLSQS
jgi:hypothetical protein